VNRINIGLIGLGTVGSGVVKVLKDRKSFLRRKIGTEIHLKKICDIDLTSRRNVRIDKNILTCRVQDILDDPQIDIVVELTGAVKPARDFIQQALQKGKHVVTANKALLAESGQELFTLAREKGKSICFESSVGAGIPLIKAIREGLVANRFSGIFGIVNGTSNYILSEMSHNGRTFNEALIQARKKGFAERNVRLDIEGIDSAHKLVVLVYLCFGRFVNLKDIFIEGISHISLLDINYAKELGLEIKLLAIAKKQGSELDVRVHPTLIPCGHLLSSVNGVFNALYASCDLAGSLLFYGPGAGQLSAASAVVADLVDLAGTIKAGLFGPTLNIVKDSNIERLRKIDEIEGRYYIRFMAIDKPGVLARISGVLGKEDISIASVTQKDRKKQATVPIVMLTHEAKERNLRRALEQIGRLNIVKQKPMAIRIEQI
jgi:homoserine dehydrogenase